MITTNCNTCRLFVAIFQKRQNARLLHVTSPCVCNKIYTAQDSYKRIIASAIDTEVLYMYLYTHTLDDLADGLLPYILVPCTYNLV